MLEGAPVLLRRPGATGIGAWAGGNRASYFLQDVAGCGHGYVVRRFLSVEMFCGGLVEAGAFLRLGRAWGGGA